MGRLAEEREAISSYQWIKHPGCHWYNILPVHWCRQKQPGR